METHFMKKIILLFAVLKVFEFGAFSQTLPAAEFLINSTVKIESIELRVDSGKGKRYATSGLVILSGAKDLKIACAYCQNSDYTD